MMINFNFLCGSFVVCFSGGEAKLNFIDEKTMWLSGSDSAYDSGEGVGGETMDQSAMATSIWTHQSQSMKNSEIRNSGKLAMGNRSDQGEVQVSMYFLSLGEKQKVVPVCKRLCITLRHVFT